MTNDPAGTISGQGRVRAGLSVSTQAYNAPPPNQGSVTAYGNDPSRPTQGSTSGGYSDIAPNTGRNLAPFLRATSRITGNSTSYGSTITFTVPATTVVGDLILLIQAGGVATPIDSTWNLLYSKRGFTAQWRYATAADIGTTIVGQGGYYTGGQIRIYGNAGGATVLATNETTIDATTTPVLTSPSGAIKADHLAVYTFAGTSGQTLYSFNAWTVSGALQNVIFSSGNYDQLVWGGDISAGQDTALSVQTARLTSGSGPGGFIVPNERSANLLIDIAPATTFAFAQVALEEATGSDADSADATSVNLLGLDKHSLDGNYGYADAPLTFAQPRSYERWVRLRFEPPFNTVSKIRFWLDEDLDVPSGWTLAWGTTPTYAAPTNTASSVAVNALPTSDPGRNNPNLNAGQRLIGTEVQHTNWLVLQATVDPTVAHPGPVYGFSMDGLLNRLELRFAWVET